MDEDWIIAGTLPSDPGLAGLSVVRLPSVSAAKKVESNGEQFLTHPLPAAARSALPADFNAKRLSEVRVCNAIVASYNPSLDPGVSRRFNVVLKLLRAAC